MRISLLSLLILVGALFGSCGGGGGKVTIRGFLNSTFPGQAVTSSPTITILGRSPDEFQVGFAGQDEPKWPLQFEMGGIPEGELIVYQVRGGDLFAAASFPILADPNKALNLGAVTQLTVTSIKNQAGAVAGGLSPNTGIILGIASPNEGNQFGRVRLLSKATGQAAVAKGPYYFRDPDGQLVNGAQTFQDTVGTYAFVNVPPGDYIAELSGGAQVVSLEALSIIGQVSFGYGIP